MKDMKIQIMRKDTDMVSLRLQVKQLEEDLDMEKRQTEKYKQQCEQQRELIEQL